MHEPDVGSAPVTVPIGPLPFRIGRGREAELVLSSPRISKLHAEIDRDGRGLLVRDLSSRNGTFVNGERVVGSHPLGEGDILHVAHRELTVVMAERDPASVDDSTLAGVEEAATEVVDTRNLYRILVGRHVRAVFQAIVTLEDGDVIGYEALGRNTLAGKEYDATTLFKIAHERSKAADLSRLMRTAALEDSRILPARGARVFMNVHPDEMHREDLLVELERAATALSGRQLVVEIHEAAIADHAQMRKLRAELRARDIELAYDDFGAGRSRLMELAEVPPDFLKLDMQLIRGIHKSPGRQELVSAIVKVMCDAGIRVIAEGIETTEEHRTCRDLGCELGQGFLIRHPVSAVDLRDTWP